MKNVIHIFGASGSGTTMARLCLSAFARVATRIFSAGAASCASLPQRIRAGCDGFETFVKHYDELCHSAFARVATDTAILTRTMRGFATAHSRGLRRITEINYPEAWAALPQRIRAGCDAETHCTPRSTRLCHSAFARVATILRIRRSVSPAFATAHSRGLRRYHRRNRYPVCSLPQRIRAGCDPNNAFKRQAVFLCHSAFARVATSDGTSP